MKKLLSFSLSLGAFFSIQSCSRYSCETFSIVGVYLANYDTLTDSFATIVGYTKGSDFTKGTDSAIIDSIYYAGFFYHISYDKDYVIHVYPSNKRYKITALSHENKHDVHTGTGELKDICVNSLSYMSNGKGMTQTFAPDNSNSSQATRIPLE